MLESRDAQNVDRPPERRARAGAFDPFSSARRGNARKRYDWRDYVRILRRRQWPAVTVFVLALGFAAVHAYTRVPTYQARVRLIIEPERRNITGLQDPLEGQQQAADFQTQFTILQSRTLARRTMEQLGIWKTPAPPAGARPAAVPPERGSFEAVIQIARDIVAQLRSGPTPPPVPLRPELRENAEETAKIDGFLAGMRVSPLPNSRLVDVTYESTDPVAAATRANALVANFIQQNSELSVAASQEVGEWLGDRLAEQRKALDASEQALQDYRREHNVVMAGDQSGLGMQKLTELTTAFSRARADRIEKEALVNQLRAVESDRSALEASPAVVNNLFLQQLRSELAALTQEQAQLSQKLGDRHPTLIKARESVQAAQRRLDAEMSKVVTAVRREYAAAQAAEKSLGDALAAQRRETLSTNGNDVQLAILERDAESNRQIYNSLMQRFNEFSVTRERRTNNIRIVDAGEVPQAPVGTGARRDLRYGAAGGLILALCLVFLLETLDNRLKTPEQVKTELHLAFLGLVPLAANSNTDSVVLTGGTSARFSEAFRGLRTNVRLSIAANGGTRVLVVTSANAGEGKTVVTGNLAIALAQADQRVLLIDADLRRPRQHAVFELEQEPGLSNLLVGDATGADVIRRTSVPGLHILTAGTIPPNPSELLESKRFATFLEQLGKYYDWAIIDSPPVLPVTDALVLAERASAVMLVTSADLTPIQAARAALGHLRTARAHVIGAVLNRADLDRHAYYYGHYYQRDYDAYYKQPAASV